MSTAGSATPDLQLLRRPRTARPVEPSGGPLLPVKETPDGWAVVTIHWSQVPGYNYEQACEGLSPEGIRQELEIDWSASKGLRVYDGYSHGKHRAVRPLRFDPRQPFYCGWDFGGCPAFVVTQMNAFGQWLIGRGLAPPIDQSIGIYEFARLCADFLQREYASPFGLKLADLRLRHYGDPAGADRPPRVGDRPRETQSCFEIIKDGLMVVIGHDRRGSPIYHKEPGLGWRIIPGEVNHTARQEAIRSRLRLTLKDGLSALVVDPRNDVIIDGFSGGYHRPQRADGTYAADPAKNWYSHSMNALEYVATRLFHLPLEEMEPDEDEEDTDREFCSHASRRYQ